MKKSLKAISAVTDDELERAVNRFFEGWNEGIRWRVVTVTAGSGYRTAWLESETPP